MIHKISTGRITLERLKEIIDKHATLALSDEATAAILKCRRYLDKKMEDPEKPMYGSRRVSAPCIMCPSLPTSSRSSSITW